ncbi:hypothetical protein EDD36DRAFT_148028 [Exophiala viscosa]|uniref:BHLH domain-containing protein n=1 Tax=Exophiala viscosa TaxID=2486360 RepID=A0AAN6IG72_9EURO|nr:hypothetical protein EDD36DRAFT_148028 [Exophiala viscosa]
MPRPKPPPTPTGSTDLKASDRVSQATDMESMFTLPPPALKSIETSTQNNQTKSSIRENSSSYTQSTPPISPQDKPLASSPRHKRTASGLVKTTSNTDPPPSEPSSSSYALPPPPSRARKIIQMKPKSAPSPDSDGTYQPPPAAAAAAPSAAVPKAASTSSNSKRKQPSATSAAGRKIARKTAHSIIERRRRSKMNEEFGVLKDMIPACEGVEMHKLAILQAGIEYVRYLEGCVAQLKGENDKQKKIHPTSRMQIDDQEEDDFDEDDEDEDEDEMAQDQPEPAPPATRYNTSVPNEWSMRDSRSSIASLSSSAHPSPHILSQTQSHADDQAGHRKRPILPAGIGSFSASPSQISTNVTSATPTPTLLSPAFNSIHFSPDLTRIQTNSSMGKSTGNGSFAAPSTSGSWTTVNPTSSPSPNMQPLPSPKAAINMPLPPHPSTNLKLPQPFGAPAERDAHSKSPGAQSDASGTAEATASAALMMLTNDWRGGAGRGAGAPTGAGAGGDDRGKGMSVRDLLSS